MYDICNTSFNPGNMLSVSSDGSAWPTYDTLVSFSEPNREPLRSQVRGYSRANH